MVWNVLWMAAMAAASALAGFCMGRLSVGTEEVYDEEGQGALPGKQRRGAWEIGAAGPRELFADWKNQGRAENNGARMASAVAPGRPESLGPEGLRPGRPQGLGPEAAEDMEEQAPPAGGGNLTAFAGGRQIPGESGYGKERAGNSRVGTAGWISERVIRGTGGGFRPLGRRYRGRGQQQPEGRKWSVGSPVKGWVTSCKEGEHPTVVIQPEDGRLYAPAAGKIMKLFPLGNAILFRTEFGAEFYLQVGNVGDDLLGRYFRPRVLRNEIVSKGKLLMEFDGPSLVKEGVSPAVTITLENSSYRMNVHVTARQLAGVGEEILLVSEYPGQGSVL